MGLFEQWPYTNLHTLNLDWILESLKELEHTIEQFVSINALKYADPIQWNIVKQYEKNTIVIDPLTGTAYISVQPVPSGVALTNTDYWTVVFDLGAFVTRAAKNFTDNWEADTTNTATFSSAAGSWLVWGDTLYRALVNITAGDTYVINSNIEHITMEDIIGHLEDLSTTDKSNLVAAINEVLQTLTDTTGSLDNLTTTDKSDLVAAINEVLQTLTDTTGSLDDLNTTDKSNLVAAINENTDKIANIDTDLSTKLDNLMIYNVKDYGATGDGITDDTQAIIDCLAANHFAYFPMGTYIISSTIYIDTGYTIIGEDKDHTIIKMADAANIDMIKTVNFDSLKGTDDHSNKQIKMSIQNITINGNYRENPDDFVIGQVNNTSGTGLSMYAGGVFINNVTIYNCADDGFYSEWNSYLSGSIVPTAQESRYINLTIKCNGKHGWNFHGPHDTDIVGLTCATNNRKNNQYNNMNVIKGGFKMTTSHLYSDYGSPKVHDSLHIGSGADPVVIVNCDIEGGGSHDLYVGNSDDIFANCRFYACYGYGDLYLAAGSKRNCFVGCHCDGQATEAGITPPSWNGAIEFGDDQPTYDLFELTLKNTVACNYYDGEKYNQWIIHGYNQQYLLDGQYRAIPDPATYTHWQKDNIIINGDFADQSSYTWLNTDKAGDLRYNTSSLVPEYFDGSVYQTLLHYVRYVSSFGALKYWDGAQYVGILNSAKYSPSDGAFAFYDGANFVIPNGSVRFNSGTNKLQYASAGSWIDVP